MRSAYTAKSSWWSVFFVLHTVERCSEQYVPKRTFLSLGLVVSADSYRFDVLINNGTDDLLVFVEDFMPMFSFRLHSNLQTALYFTVN